MQVMIRDVYRTTEDNKREEIVFEIIKKQIVKTAFPRADESGGKDGQSGAVFKAEQRGWR